MRKTLDLLDDETLFRDGIKNILSIYFDFSIRSYSSQDYEKIKSYPDYVIMDPQLHHADTEEVVSFFANVDTKIIFMASRFKEKDVLLAADYNVRGYLLKSEGDTDYLVKVLKEICHGNVFFHHLAIPVILNAYRKTKKIAGSDGVNTERFYPKNLTQREKEILRYVFKGCSNKLIGEQLSISEHTVKSHLSSVYQKFQVDNRVDLIVQWPVYKRHFKV